MGSRKQADRSIAEVGAVFYVEDFNKVDEASILTPVHPRAQSGFASAMGLVGSWCVVCELCF